MNKLFEYLEKPKLYSRSKEKFWNDEYISKRMLEYHLSNDTELASRNLKFIDESVCFINSIVTENSSILDLGCGPGLYTSRLSKNHNVVGLDISKSSLEYAKTIDTKSKYYNSSYLVELPFNDKFDLITMIYCDYGALTKDERITLLNNVKSYLKDGGFFMFDVFTKKVEEFNKFTHIKENGFWTDKEHLLLEQIISYDEYTTVFQNIVITEEVKEYLIWNTSFNLESIKKELEENGLYIDSYYSDVCGKEYSKDSETLCLIVKKKV